MLYIFTLIATAYKGSLLWVIINLEEFTPTHFLDDTKKNKE